MTCLPKNFKIRTGKLPQWHCLFPGDRVWTEIKDVYRKTWWCHNEEQTPQAWLRFDKMDEMTSRCSFQTKMFQDWGHHLTCIYSLLFFLSKHCSSSLNIYYYVNQDTTSPILFWKTSFGVWLKIHSISGTLKLHLTGLDEITLLKDNHRSIFLLWPLVLGSSCQTGA